MGNLPLGVLPAGSTWNPVYPQGTYYSGGTGLPGTQFGNGQDRGIPTPGRTTIGGRSYFLNEAGAAAVGRQLGAAYCPQLPDWLVPFCNIAAGALGQVVNGDPDVPESTGGCGPGFRETGDGGCVAITTGDPSLGVTPGEASVGGSGIFSPTATYPRRLKCPKYADGRTGILWMSALNGQVVCLPRGVNGRGFGLIRKNPPRKKAYISAAEWKALKAKEKYTKKAKAFAKAAGLHTHKAHRGR